MTDRVSFVEFNQDEFDHFVDSFVKPAAKRLMALRDAEIFAMEADEAHARGDTKRAHELYLDAWRRSHTRAIMKPDNRPPAANPDPSHKPDTLTVDDIVRAHADKIERFLARAIESERSAIEREIRLAIQDTLDRQEKLE